MLQKQIQSSIKIFSTLTHDGIFQAIKSTNYHIKQLAGNQVSKQDKINNLQIQIPHLILINCPKISM